MTSEPVRRPARTSCATLLLAIVTAGFAPGCSEGTTQPLAERVIIEDLGLEGVTVASPKDVIAVAETVQLNATDSVSGQGITGTLVWSSSDVAVATVDAGGAVTGVADGEVTVTGRIGSLSGSTTLTVSSAGLISIAIGSVATDIDVCTSGQFSATGTYADGRSDDLTDQVTWVSDNTTAATFDSVTAGLLNTRQSGTVGISAALSGIASPSVPVVITNSLTAVGVALASTSIDVGATTTVTVSGTYAGASRDITPNATVTSGTESVATVDDGTTLTGVAAGTSVITGQCNGLQSEATLTVSDGGGSATLVDLNIVGTPPFTVPFGGTLQLQAQAEYSDLTTEDVTEQATWTIAIGSGNAVSVSNVAGSRGLVTAVNLGFSTVQAEFQTETVSVQVEVVP